MATSKRRHPKKRFVRTYKSSKENENEYGTLVFEEPANRRVTDLHRQALNRCT